MSRRLLLSPAWGLDVLTPPGEEPPGEPTTPHEQPKLYVDFSTMSDISYGNSSAIVTAWRNQVGDHYTRSYGLNEQSISGGVLLSRHDPSRASAAGTHQGSIVQGVRLGERRRPEGTTYNALPLNLGRKGWLSYDFKFNSDWNYDPSSAGKLPGLCGGFFFPSAGSSSPLDNNWHGWSARNQFDTNDKSGVMYLESYAYYYQPDRRVSWTSSTGTQAGVQGWFTIDGNPSSPRFQLVKDRVYRLTQCVTLNSDENTKDGVLEMWIDGVLRFRRTGFRWVGPNHLTDVKQESFDPNRGVSGFYFSHFYGGNTSTRPPHTTHSTWYRILIGSSKEQVALGPPGPLGPVDQEPTEPEPEPTPPPASSVPDVLHGDINKMPLVSFGGVTSSRLASAFGKSLRQSNGLSHLEVRQDSSGEKYLRQRYVRASNGSPRVGFEINLGAHEEIYLSYQLFFESGWEWVKGGKLPGVGGGDTPTGGGVPSRGEGWTWRYMWRDQSGSNPPGFARIPRIEGYLYHSDQDNFYGDEIVLGPNGYTHPPIGQWITITLRAKMNTGTNFNGEIQNWINGVDHGVYTTRLRHGSQNFSADVFNYSSFYGGNNSTWAPSSTRYARFRRFKIATTAAGVDGAGAA